GKSLEATGCVITGTNGAADGGLMSGFTKRCLFISGWPPRCRWPPAPPGKSSAGGKPPARSQPALLARREADLRQELRARMTKKRRVYRHRSGQSRDATNRLRSSFRLRMAERIV